MKKPIIIALFCAAISAGLAYLFLSDLEIKYKTMSEPVKVVVALRRIPQGVLIDSGMLAEKMVPKEYVQPKAFQDFKKLFTDDGSSQYISLNTIEENEQILSTKVSKTNQDTGISNLIPDGKKALSVVFEGEALEILTPGNRIDIFAVLEYIDNGKEVQNSVFPVAQNVLVLAVGGNCIGSYKKTYQEDDSNNFNSVTIAVTIEEIKKILISCQKGSLKYAIRSIGDLKISNIEPLKLSTMIKDISKIFPNCKVTNQKEVLDIINRYTDIKRQR
jgi:pilus assembly protein CpaB